MTRALRDHVLPLAGGVNQKFNPGAAASGFARTSQNMDCFDEYLSLAKVPGSSTVTDNAGGAVKSLHQFEYSDRAGTRQRKQLVLTSAGILKVRAGSSTLTALGSGFYPEALCSAVAREHIFLSGQNQRGFDTGGKKYDGTNLRNWGVLAPGTKPLLFDHVNDDTRWIAATDSVAAESTTSFDGYGSIQVDKTGVAANRYGRIDASAIGPFDVFGVTVPAIPLRFKLGK